MFAPPPYVTQLIFYVQNIGAPLTVTFLLLRYVDIRRREAEARSEELLTNAIPSSIATRLKQMAKRVFVSLASEDKNYRDLLKGQALNTNSPIEHTDFSVKEPWSSAWKTQCRERIRGCNGLIALLSRNSLSADGQRWEIKCAVDEAKPVLGVYIHANEQVAPSEMDGKRKITWNWDGIAAFRLRRVRAGLDHRAHRRRHGAQGASWGVDGR